MASSRDNPLRGWQVDRALIGTVMQEDRLFSGSVADNICFFDSAFDSAQMLTGVGSLAPSPWTFVFENTNSVYVAEETVVVKSSGQRNGPSGLVER